MLQRVRLWFDSIKNRAVVVVIVLVVLITLIATLVGITLGQSELEDQVRAQLATDAGIIADDIDDKLAERFDALTRVADSLTMSEASLIGRAQLILERQGALRALFHRLYLIDASGLMRAALPDNSNIIGGDVSGRDYFRLTSQQLTTLVSEPFMTLDEGRPVIAVTAPIFDHDKRMIGIIAGSINLDERSFLGQLKKVTIGRLGYVTVGTRSGKTLIQPNQAPAIAPLDENDSAHQAARRGQEGIKLVKVKGQDDRLVAYRQLNEAPWFVTVALPLSQAYAPIRRLSEVLAWVAAGLLALFIPLSLRLFSNLLRPIQQLAEQIDAQHAGDLEQPLDVGGGREIRQLVDTFTKVRAERVIARQELEQQEAYFRSLSERSPIGIVQTDVLGRIEFANPAFEAVIGYPLERLRGQPFLLGVHREDQRKLLSDWREVQRRGEVYRGEYRLFDRQAGRTIWVSCMTSPIQTKDRSLGTISVIRDITHELEIEAELRVARGRAERILDVLEEGVIMTDNFGFISFANPPSQAFIGSPTPVVGFNLFELLAVDIDGERWGFDDFRGQPQVAGLDAVMTNVRQERFEVELTMLQLEGEQSADQFVFVLRDDSERRRREELLSWEATHDSLTRLSNRRAFNSSLINLLMQETGDGNASVVMLIDLDHFKPVNDNGGHLLGDELLRHIADILRSRVRQSDMVARLGGDEFGVILPACGLERAESIAESLRAGIEALVLEQDGQSFSVTASIGLAAIEPGETSSKTVLTRADEAAYVAKAEGRNRVIVSSAGGPPGRAAAR